MIRRLFVYNALTGEAASLTTEVLSGHRLRSSRQLKAKQPDASSPDQIWSQAPKQPPLERLALVSPLAGAHPGPPSGRTEDQRGAPRAPGLSARYEGTAPHPGPVPPRSGPLTREPSPPPALVSVHKSLIKQARVTFPLIPPQVRGKLKGMQIQGSAGEVRTTWRSGWGTPFS